MSSLSNWEPPDAEADEMPAPPRILDRILEDIQPPPPPAPPPAPSTPPVLPPRSRPNLGGPTPVYTASIQPSVPLASVPVSPPPRRSGMLVAFLMIALVLNLMLAVVIVLNYYRERSDLLAADAVAADRRDAPARVAAFPPATAPAPATPEPAIAAADVLASIDLSDILGDEDTPAAEPPPADRTLSIAKLVLCRNVGGFGNYDPIPDTNIRPRHIPYIQAYVEIAHPKAEPRDDGRHVYYMTKHVKLYRADVGPTQPLMDTTMSLVSGGQSPRQDFHSAQHLQTPRTVAPGRYTLLVRVTDQISGEAATAETSFVVHPE